MKIVGHQKEIELIKTYLGKNYDSLSLLYEGKDCIGKKLIAFLTARGFLCEKKEGLGCGKCQDCKLVNNIISNIYENTNLTPHPNVKFIPYDGKEIKIDSIRDAISFLSLKASKGKVLIIEKAENMNTESANALLKTLEEPPLNTLIILTTSNQNKILPTILSRLKKIRFSKLSNEEVRDILSLRVSDEKKLENLVKIADGSLCLPFAALNKENVYNLAHSFYELLKTKKHTEGLFSIAAAVDKFDVEDTELFFDIILRFFEIDLDNLKLSDKFAERFLIEIKKGKNAVLKGVKKKLILEGFYYNLKEVNVWIT
ncbi:DNA polymerase III subunit delta', partial [Sulfurihydrogenibium sp.]|uniref:DNA polymerase III subunit delta' n=1 Tax=Sulfurihydrogenibium sp. TaxID=2053621 RepID=UPI000CAEE6AD|nr:MAG: DNA polymerase III subunit delta' [Sulfurihydrogenibium sp.]